MAIPIFDPSRLAYPAALRQKQPSSNSPLGLFMAHVRAKARMLVRSAPSGAFDQYLLDIQKLPMISDPEEEKRLARRALAGDETAAERLVTANLRFVISYVKKYQGHGLDLSELVAIGNEGLLKAVKKFDPDHGVKFISYAVWWVRQAVLKALAEQTRSVRIPLNQNSALVRMARAQSFLAQELGREPTDQEIATALNDTLDNIRSARTSGESRSFSKARSRIWRIRSRVTPSSSPIFSRVSASEPSSRP